jgi:hypothetical protein
MRQRNIAAWARVQRGRFAVQNDERSPSRIVTTQCGQDKNAIEKVEINGAQRNHNRALDNDNGVAGEHAEGRWAMSQALSTVRATCLPRRGLPRKEAAAYAGCESLSTFSDWVRRRIMPGPIPGTHTWDRKAIDASLDRLSGLQPTISPSPFDQWKAEQDAR